MINHWALMTSTTTGTGSLALTAVTGLPAFADIVGANRYFRYVIEDDTTGFPIASGIGTLSSGTTLVRGATEKSWNGSAYAFTGSPVTLAAGTKRVLLTAMANDVTPAVPAVQSIAGQKQVLPDGLSPANGQNKTLTANIVFASCLLWNCARPITAMSCAINTLAGTGSDRIQLGIYACKEDGSPGNLIARTGDILPNTTGFKSASLSGGDIELPPGYYWFVMCSSVAPVIQAYQGGSPANGVAGTPMGMTSGVLNSGIGSSGVSASGNEISAISRGIL